MSEPIITRQRHIDCAHGLMILYMMLYHICDSTIFGTSLYDIITRPLSFFMAWFFFKSGMFYKDRTLYEVIRVGLIRLIIPAITFSLIGFVFYLVFYQTGFSFSNEFAFFYLYGCFKGNTPLWFLFSLFIVQILFVLFNKLKINHLLIPFISIGLYFLNKYVGFRPYWTLYIPIGLLFYSLGMIFKELQYNNQIIIVFIVIYFSFILFSETNIFALGKYTPFFIVIPFSLAGCILTNVIFKSFKRICIAPLCFFCQHAMEFLCTHMIIIKLIEFLIKRLAITYNIIFECVAFILYLFIFSTILYFFKLNKLQWMFGRERALAN